MISFVRSINTGQGHLIFYFNELPCLQILVSVVDRKNRTHLLYYDKKSAAWQSSDVLENLSFWTGEVKASLEKAIQHEFQLCLSSNKSLASQTASLITAA